MKRGDGKMTRGTSLPVNQGINIVATTYFWLGDYTILLIVNYLGAAVFVGWRPVPRTGGASSGLSGQECLG